MEIIEFSKGLAVPTKTDLEILKAAIKDAVNNGKSFVIQDTSSLGVYMYIKEMVIRELKLGTRHITDTAYRSLDDIPKNTLVVIESGTEGNNGKNYDTTRWFTVFYNR